MSVPLPTIEQLREISTRTGLSVTDSELTTYIELMRKSIDSYNVLGITKLLLKARLKES